MKPTIVVIYIVLIVLLSATITSVYINWQCPDSINNIDSLRAMARQGVADYLKNPDKSELTEAEAHDIVEFTKGAALSSNNIICNILGRQSRNNILTILQKINASIQSVNATTGVSTTCNGCLGTGGACMPGGCLFRSGTSSVCIANGSCDSSNLSLRCNNMQFQNDSSCITCSTPNVCPPNWYCNDASRQCCVNTPQELASQFIPQNQDVCYPFGHAGSIHTCHSVATTGVYFIPLGWCWGNWPETEGPGTNGWTCSSTAPGNDISGAPGSTCSCCSKPASDSDLCVGCGCSYSGTQVLEGSCTGDGKYFCKYGILWSNHCWCQPSTSRNNYCYTQTAGSSTSCKQDANYITKYTPFYNISAQGCCIGSC